jgi:carbonic anhydrase
MFKSKKLLIAAFLVAGIFFAASAFAQDAEEALALLKKGNARFAAMETTHPNVTAERRTDTAVNGQKPFAIVLACSDSRVPVETIFDRGIGDIFVVRVAGNIAMDASVIGSIEYGAGHLNIPVIVIMGHTDCGAVKAAISGLPLEGDLRAIQETIEAAVEKVKKDQPALQCDALTSAVVKENIFKAASDLLAKSDEIRHMVGEGKLKIVLAVYDLKTGAVEWIASPVTWE